jgi:hypothetical protein
VPAKRVGRLEMSVAMLKAKNENLPWREWIEQRNREIDLEMEPELNRMRVEYFYGKPGQPPRAGN